MKAVVLTTDTLHHTYFLQELNKEFPVDTVLVERNILPAPFETHHPFEDIREDYERRVFFQDKPVLLKDVANIAEVGSVNDPESVSYLREIAPDVIIVFGTGRISHEVIQICPDTIINLHGGDPEQYRGLDSHLWAIYHHDFGALMVTLHHLNERLDDGAIILQAEVPLKTGIEIYELRRYNTETCVVLTTSALSVFNRQGRFVSRPQSKCGRYYSFMPAVLKEICRVHFKEYTTKLK